ncbi:hypothetical protein Mgra_00002414 [Meloidogyne graminicola]|uniref:Uncharacterized protein n=1 Tax=Meloidogyne graminicola TaxID=189291 RepID=A0A8S9ZYV6_9BILA|nr:hypothetical protein Mgra_00002414 [Meloidogyne graminicola]
MANNNNNKLFSPKIKRRTKTSNKYFNNKFGQNSFKYWSTTEGTSTDEEKETKEKEINCCIKPNCGFIYTSNRKFNKETRMEHGPREYLSCKDIGIDFCARTSSHGIPFVGTNSFFGRPFWATVTAIAFCSFIIQTYYTLSDYLEYRTIIEMQLKFEPAPFPAATICNLNAFKLSEVRKYEEIEQGIQLWERAISTLDRFKPTNTPLIKIKRKRRQQAIYIPILARCVCTNYNDQCVPQQYFPDEHNKNSSVCLCYEDQQTGDIWPCYAHFVWKQKHCIFCSHSNTCDDPDLPNNKTNNNQNLTSIPCLCQPVSHYCLKDNRKLGQDFKWWNPHNYTIYPFTTKPPPSDLEEAFGLEDLKDRGAITTRTKENLIFLVAGMSRQVRQSLSYTLHEFVLRCSFNSKDCDLNSWTFNFNDSVELKNSRAGPMYGLRLLLNVNQSDYMPTTEAAGVRIVVHEQDQEPFPDTFGYSAPTGFVSSFGLKTKILHRLDAPYGKCSDTFRPTGYIYAEHYSPEGCYRNCFQHIILERCGCGDPRFPLPNEKEDRPCDARNPKERSCLSNQTAVLGGFHHLTHDCHCVQPCTENTFETAYSAASWPAQNFNIGQDDCALVLGNNFTMDSCIEYYRKNTAYIEIYYEQLNYEKLKETPGYTLVNLFSDLGGNIGLWIGFSLITVLEIVELIFECFTYGCKQCIYKPLKRKAQIRKQNKRQQNIQEDNLNNAEIENNEVLFRHAGTKISRHISLLEPGYQSGGRQYQRRFAGNMRISTKNKNIILGT